MVRTSQARGEYCTHEQYSRVFLTIISVRLFGMSEIAPIAEHGNVGYTFYTIYHPIRHLHPLPTIWQGH